VFAWRHVCGHTEFCSNWLQQIRADKCTGSIALGGRLRTPLLSFVHGLDLCFILTEIPPVKRSAYGSELGGQLRTLSLSSCTSNIIVICLDENSKSRVLPHFQLLSGSFPLVQQNPRLHNIATSLRKLCGFVWKSNHWIRLQLSAAASAGCTVHRKPTVSVPPLGAARCLG
jgi:hypothetical protein